MSAPKILRPLVVLFGLTCAYGCSRSEHSSAPRGRHASLDPSPVPTGSAQYIAASLTTETPPPAAESAPAAPPLLVPFVSKPVLPSSHFEASVWAPSVNTHTLLDAKGTGAVPVSEARFLWGSGNLYVNFYAGDLDLEAHATKHDGAVWQDDSVTFAFFDGTRKRLIGVSVTGVLADGQCPRDAESLGDPRCDLGWESHARLGIDSDGTLNHLHDFDEEWNLQLAIPLASLAARAVSGTELSFSIVRCEMAYDGPRACGRWGNSREPAKLVLK